MSNIRKKRGTPMYERILMMTRTAGLLLVVWYASSAYCQTLGDFERGEDGTYVVELNDDLPVLKGHGHSQLVEYPVDFAGDLFLSLTSSQINPFLLVENESFELVAQDDDSGGGTAAFVCVSVQPETVLFFQLAATPGEVGELRLKVFEAMETEHTLRLAVEGGRALTELSRDRARDLESARNGLSQMLHRIVSTQGQDNSAALADLAWRLGFNAYELGSLAVAAAAWEFTNDFRERSHSPDHLAVQEARGNLAAVLRQLGNLPRARVLEEKVVEVMSRTLAKDHPSLLKSRLSLAATMMDMGELVAARSIAEEVLDAYERTLQMDHVEVLLARQNVALMRFEMGELRSAKALFEEVIVDLERTYSEENPFLLSARRNLAVTKKKMGDPAGAKEIEETVLATYERIYPKDHPDVLACKQNLAITIREMGDAPQARKLEEEVLAVREERLPPEHPDLLAARLNLAATMRELGDHAAALQVHEQVFAILERTLPPEHPRLLTSKSMMAGSLTSIGRLATARTLYEQVLAVRERKLPDDHPLLEESRMNLAGTMQEMGDLTGARALYEKAITARANAVSAEHPDLIKAWLGLAITMFEMGDVAKARELEESLLVTATRSLPPKHPTIQLVRVNLALSAHAMGDFERARKLAKSVLAARESSLIEQHPDVQIARLNMAVLLDANGEHASAGDLFEQVLETREKTLAEGDSHLQLARRNLSVNQVFRKECLGAIESGRSLVRGSFAALRGGLNLSRRQWEMVAIAQERDVSYALSLAAIDPSGFAIDQQFELVESLRAIGATRGRLLRGIDIPPSVLAELDSISEDLLVLNRKLRQALFRTVHSRDCPAASEARTLSKPDDFASLLRRKERLESQSAAQLESVARAQGVWFDASAEGVLAALPNDAAAVGCWRYIRTPVDLEAGVVGDEVPAYVAFVLRKGQPLQRVELGSEFEVRSALAAWHTALKADTFDIRQRLGGRLTGIESDGHFDETRSAVRLRELVFDPLRAALGNSRRLVLALDGVLHLIPFGALPGRGSLGEGGVLSDHFRFEFRTTLKELTTGIETQVLPDRGEPFSAKGARLVAFGGIDYASQTPIESVRGKEEAKPGVASIRSLSSRSSWGGRQATPVEFEDLPGAREEVRDLAELFHRAFSGSRDEAIVLADQSATRDAFLKLAPSAQFLHLATHGFVEDETIPSICDSVGNSVLGSYLSSHRAHVRGLSPMSISGIALAGANNQDLTLGGSLGAVTADEIADLDLTRCDLVVFSACGSHVGVERAGQGLKSLQHAAFIAGARRCLSSLWMVPDHATRTLMRRFYESWWIHGASPWEALRDAQHSMRRETLPGSNALRYRTRDWAGWVLTGDPD